MAGGRRAPDRTRCSRLTSFLRWPSSREAIPLREVHSARRSALAIDDARAWDVVATRTPGGVSSLQKPRMWFKPGDEISIASPTLGQLDTRIAR